MKKLLFIMAIGLTFLAQSCYDEYKFDFDYTATYFAKQFPIRTVVLEEGKDLSFEIGVVLGGVYENNQDHYVSFQVETGMLDSITEEYPDIKLLPQSYYELSDNEKIVIPSGQVNGNISVMLNKDQFLNDTLSHTVSYALPLLITETTADSVLIGKEYTVAVVRYFNSYHGSYWLRGVDYTMDVAGNYTDTVKYTNEDLVDNRDLLLETVSKSEVLSTYIGANSTGVEGSFSMKIGVLENGACLLDGVQMSDLSNLVGGGRYDAKTKMFTLDYSYLDAGGIMHDVFDTLYYRNTELYVERWR